MVLNTYVYTCIYMSRGKLSKSGFTLREDSVEGYYKKTVTAFGNGAKVDSFRDFIGHEVVVIVLKGVDNEQRA